MSVAERERVTVPWSDRERALLSVLDQAEAAGNDLTEQNNDLRADRMALRLTVQLIAGMAGHVRERFEVELPAVVPLVQDLIDELARAEEVADRTLNGSRTQPLRTPFVLAAEGVEPGRGIEGSRSAGDAASPPVPGEVAHARDSRPRPQRILEALEAVV